MIEEVRFREVTEKDDGPEGPPPYDNAYARQALTPSRAHGVRAREDVRIGHELAEQLLDVEGDHELLVRRDHEDANLGVLGGDVTRVA